MVFKLGPQGLGYYPDILPTVTYVHVPAAAEEQCSSALAMGVVAVAVGLILYFLQKQA